MYQDRRVEFFKRFLAKRSEIIEEYDNNEISKRELLENNYQLLRRMHLTPFVKIDSFEKGMYNYQYYNTLAKYYRHLAKKEKPGRKYKRRVNNHMNKCNHYYRLKDLSSLKLLEYLEFKNIRAYFIKTDSKNLEEELFEIVLCDFDKAIFHSKSKKLLEVLRKAGVFEEGLKKSVIADYINEKY